MIVKLKYEDVKGNTLKLGIDGKKVPAYMRVAVDQSNVIEAVENFKNYKNVVLFDYTGDMQTLSSVTSNVTPICIKFNLDCVDETIDDIMGSIPTDVVVRVIIELPSDFCDMRIIHKYSEKYSNVRFCGGKFLRLEGCNIGCIGVEDIPKKVPSSKIKVSCEGCACIYTNVDINDYDFVEFTDEVTPVKIKEPKPKTTTKKSNTGDKPKKEVKKKPVSSLLSVAKANGFSNF